MELLNRVEHAHPIETLSNVITLEELIELQRETRNVFIDQPVKTYLLNIIHATRLSREIELGASPRASIALMRTSQAYALVMGRAFVTPDDVKKVAPYVLSHRIRLKNDVLMKEKKVEDVLLEVIKHIRVPVDRKRQVT